MAAGEGMILNILIGGEAGQGPLVGAGCGPGDAHKDSGGIWVRRIKDHGQ